MARTKKLRISGDKQLENSQGPLAKAKPQYNTAATELKNLLCMKVTLKGRNSYWQQLRRVTNPSMIYYDATQKHYLATFQFIPKQAAFTLLSLAWSNVLTIHQIRSSFGILLWMIVCK